MPASMRWTRRPLTSAFRCFRGLAFAGTKQPSSCTLCSICMCNLMARFRRHKAAIKLHTLLDLHGNIPTFIGITDGKTADVKMLDEIIPEAGAFYVMDRGYIDFERLYGFTLSAAFFVVRTKKNILLERRYSHEVDKSTGVRSDQTVILKAIASIKVYPDALRRVSYVDPE